MKTTELTDEEFEHFTILLQDDMISADMFLNEAFVANEEQIEIAKRHYKLSKSILEKL